MIGAPSIFRVIRKVDVLGRILPHFDLRIEENDTRWKWKSPLFDSGI